MDILLKAFEQQRIPVEFALGQFDLMEYIGKEVEIVRETNASKKKFSNVINGINSIKPFVEINWLNERFHYDDADDLLTDNWFLRNLWMSHCEGWAPECEIEEWYGSDEECIIVKEDWFKACPFKYHYGGTGDYYTVLNRVEDDPQDANIDEWLD